MGLSLTCILDAMTADNFQHRGSGNATKEVDAPSNWCSTAVFPYQPCILSAAAPPLARLSCCHAS